MKKNCDLKQHICDVLHKIKKNIIKCKTIAILLLCTVCIISLGYASLSTDIAIDNTSVLVSPISDVRIIGASFISGDNSGISNMVDYNTNKVYSNISLPNSDSNVTYRVEIMVLHSEMQLDELTISNSNLSYELTNYKIGDVLCNTNNECSNGAVIELDIVIKYKNNGYDGNTIDYPFELNFLFNPLNKAVEMDNKYYDTIGEALNLVPTDGTKKNIKMLKDIQELVEIKAGQNVKFDFDNHAISNIANRPIIENRGTLEIINGTFNSDSTQGAINNYSDASLKLYDSNIIATGTRQGVYIKGGTVEIGGNTYIRNTTNERAAVQNDGGILTILSGTFVSEANAAVQNKATLVIGTKDGSVDISSPVFQGYTYGINTTRNISFFDGIIKGITAAINDDFRITTKEDDFYLINNTEKIGSDIYKTMSLELPLEVTFDPNNGTVNENLRYVVRNTKIGVLPVPKMDDYAFVGWYLKDDIDGEKVTKDTIITHNVELIAKWKKASEMMVAKIGTTTYNTLQDALDNASTEYKVVVKLLADAYESVTVPAGKHITFDFTDYTLTSPDNRAAVINFGTLKIKSGTIVSLSTNTAAVQNEGGDFEILGGSIIAAGERQAVYNLGGITRVSGTAYLYSSAPNRPAIQSLNNDVLVPEVYITGGTIISQRQEAIRIDGGTLTIGSKDGIIDKTTPILQGGTYGVRNNGIFNFYDGTIKGRLHSIENDNITEIEENSERIWDNELINGVKYYFTYLVMN